MPTIKIELLEGYDKESLLKMKNTVVEAVLKVLKLPEDDRNIRLVEYPAGMFEMKPPLKLLIEICMFSGRSDEAKRLLYKTIVDDLDSTGLVKKDEIMIVVHEPPMVNWGINGGIPANEVDLDFKVDI